MAIRYSGDVELRIEYGGAGYIGRQPVFEPDGQGFYYAHIRAPHVRNAAILSLREVGLTRKQNPRSSESYDTVALAFIKWAELHIGKLPVELDNRNRIVVRRTFQSPCPVN